jgi:large subunit ribosomal protein L18
MIMGVTQGFSRIVLVEGVGYAASTQGRTLLLNVGFANQVRLDLPQGVDVQLSSPQRMIFSGPDLLRGQRKPVIPAKAGIQVCICTFVVGIFGFLYMKASKATAIRRRKCRRRVRSKVIGTQDRPRLSVFRSNRHIYAQLIDDAGARTILAASTRQSALAKELSDGRGSNKSAAQIVGQAIATAAVAKGITRICFDRGHYRYHGRVRALAEAAREAGLTF